MKVMIFMLSALISLTFRFTMGVHSHWSSYVLWNRLGPFLSLWNACLPFTVFPGTCSAGQTQGPWCLSVKSPPGHSHSCTLHSSVVGENTVVPTRRFMAARNCQGVTEPVLASVSLAAKVQQNKHSWQPAWVKYGIEDAIDARSMCTLGLFCS